MTKLWLDLETYSEVPITHGTHSYAAGASVMLLAWALDDGPVQVWDVTANPAPPQDLQYAKFDEVWAHNSHFDRTVLKHAMPSLVPTKPEFWRDTMVQALSHGLPGSLGQLCEILKLPTDVAKDKEGKRFIQLFCKPRPANTKVRRATRETHPAEWARFVEYAALDIEAMRAIHAKLPEWNYKTAELALWHLDQRINDRGVAIDMDLVRGAMAAVAVAQKGLKEDTAELTDDQLLSTTQAARMQDYVLENIGIDMPNLQMSTVERMIEDPETPAELRALLDIRLQASTTSTTKYKSLLNGTSKDSRLRGTLQFNGASRTGRWAGRLFQPQNLPRPSLKQHQIDMGIEAIKAGSADLVVDNVMQLTSSAIRGAIVAPQGKRLVVADLSNIEGRVQAWLAGEEWKLQAFREFDAGVGPDLYKLAYSKSFGVKPDAVTKDQRQVGKVQELALGYEGGVGAFVTFAGNYGIDLEDLAAKVLPVAPGWAVDEATGFYKWTIEQKRQDFGLSRDAFVACDAVKRGWRKAHGEIAMHWGELKNAVVSAIEQPGNTFTCRRLKIRRDGSWLRIGLPSGRAVCYPSPLMVDNTITYMGVNQFSRKWCRLKTYGGKIFENICQAVARDVMAANMQPIEDQGYAICLTVHDELITEAPDTDEFNADALSLLLAARPSWATDMPLAAAGFETNRYRKD
jgi:DNA polymerase